MDRHRQEWLDYACSEQVLFKIESKDLPVCQFRFSCICYTLYGQSKDATCEDYSRVDSSDTPDMEDVTSLTPLQKGCKIDGEAVRFNAFYTICV